MSAGFPPGIPHLVTPEILLKIHLGTPLTIYPRFHLTLPSKILDRIHLAIPAFTSLCVPPEIHPYIYLGFLQKSSRDSSIIYLLEIFFWFLWFLWKLLFKCCWDFLMNSWWESSKKSWRKSSMNILSTSKSYNCQNSIWKCLRKFSRMLG